ncbi:MAG: glycosyl hydrolase family 95 catalytic domain-containing protein [Planctomycetota bacterium]
MFAFMCGAFAGHREVIGGETPDAPPPAPQRWRRLKLWYRKPATDWQKQALPIGNGRLGGMVFGGITKEHIQFNEDSLWIGDEQDTGAYQAFGDIYVELGEAAGNVGVSNPSGHHAARGQEVSRTVDGNVQTKWCVEHKGRAVVWQVTFAGPVAAPLESYTFTSAEDVPSRDPKAWRLLGSDDGAEWALLDKRSLDGPFAARHRSRTFTFDNRKRFRSYRFVFEPTDRTHFQVAEIALGEPGSAFRRLPGTGAGQAAAGESYARTLHLDTATHETRYTRGGTTWRRRYFSSNPAGVMVMRFTADRPGAHSGRIVLADAHGAKADVRGNRITIAGSLAGHVYRGGSSSGRKKLYAIALDYEAQLVVVNEGGTLEAAADGIAFKKCDSLTLLLAAGTNYVNRRDRGWKGEHPGERIAGRLAAASRRGFDELFAEHVRDYRELFFRCALDLGETPERERNLPTDERLAAYKKGSKDPELEELLFQYARYLIISCSRPGSMPANLQGLWNRSNRPPWRSDYHTDVNVQMNYWFTGPAALGECAEPLAEWFYSIRDVRRDETAKAFKTRGWITHAENGIFGGSTWKWSKGDAAWVAQNLWDHFAFTQDREFLRARAYPVMKDLCEFWEDHLKELPGGTLVSPNGFSPEHGPHEDGVSFDQQLVWDLFTNYIAASEALGLDEPFRRKVTAMRERLLGPKIGKWGQLQEWMVDRDDPNDRHRHLSHLVAAHPGRQISPNLTPALAKAARVSLEARGHRGDVGWSNAWKISLWARLHDPKKAYWYVNRWAAHNTFANLYNACWPGRTFQIEGNFGYAGGVCEMLLQSHAGAIHFLPALPDAWPTGSVRGMRARGGVEVDIEWRDGRATSAVLRAKVGGTHVLRAPAGQRIAGPEKVTLAAGRTHRVEFE